MELEDTERERSSAPWALAATLVLASASFGVVVYVTRADRVPEAAGLDLDEAPAPDMRDAPALRLASVAPPASSLMLLVAPKLAAAPPPRERAEADFVKAGRSSEGFFTDFTIRYQRKYPVLNQWSYDWMAYPDLRRANNDWWRTKNPVRFAFQIAESPNLPRLISKYSSSAELRAYVVDLIASAPADVMKAARGYLQADGRAGKLLGRFAQAAGLPSALVGGFTGEPVDPNAALRQLLDSAGLKAKDPRRSR